MPHLFPIDTRDPRFQPFYTASEVARITRVTPVKLAYWAKSAVRGLPPLINLAGKHGSLSPYSFMNLMEAYVLASLRHEHGLKMSNIRNAVRWLKDRYPNHPHPLASLALETDELEVFVRESEWLVSASKCGQIVFR